jgi:transcription attenuation protein (tryptophan RNA-binding attenuator protein)
MNSNDVQADYIVVKALRSGVSVSGLTRGGDTKFLHSEKLDRGEVFVAQFTANVSVMKIRGLAEVYTKYGMIKVESVQEVELEEHRIRY